MTGLKKYFHNQVFENVVFLHISPPQINPFHYISCIRPDLKICWFAVTRPSLQETYGSKIFFDVHSRKKISYSQISYK